MVKLEQITSNDPLQVSCCQVAPASQHPEERNKSKHVDLTPSHPWIFDYSQGSFRQPSEKLIFGMQHFFSPTQCNMEDDLNIF